MHVARATAALAVALVIVAVPARSDAPSTSAPPPTRTDDVTETHHGHAVVDPYRWLEATATPPVADWFRAQNDHARAFLDGLPERAGWRERIAELNAADVRVNDAQWGGDELFYMKRSPGDESFRLYVRHGIDGAERLLVDPAGWSSGEANAAIDYFRASPNGRRVAFGVSTGGSENATMHVIDVMTGKPIGPPIPRARDGAPSWRFDSSVLFYRQLKEGPEGAPASVMFRDSRAYSRTFAPDGRTLDAPVLGRGLSADVALDPDDSPSVVVSPVSPYAIGVVQHGVEREVSVYVAPLSQVSGTATPWRKLAGPEAGITDLDLRGEWIYLVTNQHAPRYRVVRWSLKEGRPYDGDAAEVVVPQSDRVVTGVGVAKDALYVQQLDAGNGRLLRLEYNVNLRKDASARAAPPPAPARSGSRQAKPGVRTPKPAALPKTAGVARAREITLPFAGAIQERVTDPLRSGALLRLAGWTQAPAYFVVDGKSGALTRSALMPPARADFSAMMVSEVRVRTDDGASVPLTIVHRRDVARDGSAPLLIDAYGAYGYVQEPRFWPTLLAWLERGGVFAVAHVRGGGELGKDWHLAGRKSTKANGWRDLIACAEHLVRERWSAPTRTAAIGASAGGLVVGNALATRPDLFAAIVSKAGFHDAIRSENGAAGPANVSEFGTVATDEGFRDLLAMSPYAKIRDGVAYPAALLTTGFNDQRVDPWDPGKMAARLQRANASAGGSGKPVLLRVDFAGGHGITSTREQAIDEWTDVFAFLQSQLGGLARR